MNLIKLKNSFLILCMLLLSMSVQSQQLVYNNTFNELATGVYDSDTAKEAFGVSFFKGADEGRVAIVPFNEKGNVLRASYPKGQVKTNNSGFHTKLFWENSQNEQQDELYLSYNLYIPADFEFRAGAKIPGLAYQTRDRNMSVRLMWRRDGRLEYYNHFNTRPTWDGWSASVDWSFTGPYTNLVDGEVQADQAKLKKGQWNHIELYNKLNTPGQNDGIMRAWLNGTLAIDITDNEDYRQADEGDIGLNCIYLSTFFGGTDETYQPTKDQYAYFDDFIISKSRIGQGGEQNQQDSEEETTEEPTEDDETDNTEEEEEEEEEVSNENEDNSTSNCNFSTPSNQSIPTLNRITYNNTYVLGTGGPSLSNISKFRINWSASSSKLNQFAFNTTNGSPSYYIDLRSNLTQNFSTTNPDITITNSGINGLDGSYWATVTEGNFVLVSKTSNFTIYFSNDSAPDCNQQLNKSIAKTKNNAINLKVFPNPIINTVNISGLTEQANVAVIDMLGKTIFNTIVTTQESQVEVSQLSEGVYFLKLNGTTINKTITFIKK